MVFVILWRKDITAESMLFKKSDSKKIKHEFLGKLLTGRVLDVGYASYPSPVAHDFYGVDIQNREAPKGYKEVKSADLNTEPIPYPDGFFDTVIAADVIEHVMNPLKVFLEINRILKKGGKFIFVVPNPYFYREIIFNIFVNFFIKTNTIPPQEAHINLPSRHIARTMFYWSGFTLKKEFGFSFPIPKTKFLLSMYCLPSLAYEIIYVTEKTEENPKFSIITKRLDKGVWERDPGR